MPNFHKARYKTVVETFLGQLHTEVIDQLLKKFLLCFKLKTIFPKEMHKSLPIKNSQITTSKNKWAEAAQVVQPEDKQIFSNFLYSNKMLPENN